MIVLAWTGGQAVAGKLAWDVRKQSGAAGPGDSEVHLEYRFRNESDEAIEIEDIRVSCGCMASELEDRRIEAGETGVLKIVFTVGNRTGLQQKTIAVREKGESAPTVLIAEVQLPEPVRVEPAVLEWKRDEALEPKVLSIRAGEGVEVEKVVSTNPAIRLKKQNREKWEVNPADVERPLSALIRVTLKGAGTVAVPVRIE